MEGKKKRGGGHRRSKYGGKEQGKASEAHGRKRKQASKAEGIQHTYKHTKSTSTSVLMIVQYCFFFQTTHETRCELQRAKTTKPKSDECSSDQIIAMTEDSERGTGRDVG